MWGDVFTDRSFGCCPEDNIMFLDEGSGLVLTGSQLKMVGDWRTVFSFDCEGNPPDPDSLSDEISYALDDFWHMTLAQMHDYFCDDARNKDCDDSKDCTSGRGAFKITCPTEFKDGEVGNWLIEDAAPNTTFKLENEDSFYKAIYDDYGIEKDWIEFGNTHVYLKNGCQYSDDINKCANDDVKVSNPKDIIGDTDDKSRDLLSRLNVLITMADYDGLEDPADLVDAAMLPALSINSAVSSMGEDTKQAEEIKKAERQEMILSFITGVLFFIPFVGSAAGAAGLTTVRTILGMLGPATDAGLLTWGPGNAFATIFSTLATAGIGAGGWGKAARVKRGMSSKDIDALGSIKDRVNQFEGVKVTSCKT
ncbi:hypothetical protein GGI43DRAFT_383617 [Trichoderma evansii]